MWVARHTYHLCDYCKNRPETETACLFGAWNYLLTKIDEAEVAVSETSYFCGVF